MSATHRIAALESWANTPNRAARTRPAHAASPASVEWHLHRQTGALAAAAMPARLAAAESARRAHMLRMAEASAKARATRKGAAA